MASRSSSRHSEKREGSSSSMRSMTSKIDSIIDMYIDRPLPPTPGRPSASPLSFMSHLSRGSSTSLKSTKSEGFKQQNLLKRVSKIPDSLRIKGGNLEKLMHAQPQEKIKEVKTDEKPSKAPQTKPLRPWKIQDIHPGSRVMTPPAWQEPSLEEDGVTVEDAGSKVEMERGRSLKRRSKRSAKTAVDDYFGRVSPQSPYTAAMLLNPDSSYEPSPITPIAPWPETELFFPMESRISNVIDDPIGPDLLAAAQLQDEEEAGERKDDRRRSGGSDHPSETSSVQSNATDDCGDLPTIFQNTKYKAYGPQRRPSSKYPSEGMRPDSECFDEDLDDDNSDNGGEGGGESQQSGFEKFRSNSLAVAEADLFDDDPAASHAPEVARTPTSPSDRRRRGSLSDRLKSVKLRNPPLQVRVGHHPKVPRQPLTTKDERFKAKKLLGSLPIGKEKRSQKQERDERVAELRSKIRHVLPEKPVEEGGGF